MLLQLSAHLAWSECCDTENKGKYVIISEIINVVAMKQIHTDRKYYKVSGALHRMESLQPDTNSTYSREN